MSLLIEGMDMPKDCASCDLSYYRDGYNGGYGYSPSGWMCRRLNHIIKEGEETRPSDCPLVEVPTPHGRLIDADAHIQSLKENQCGERCRKNLDCVNCGIGMYIRIVENEPTIIEAEGKT